MNLVFILAGLMAIAGVVGVILARQPVHQVIATVFSFIGLAALYLSLQNEFLAVIQLIVYGGAVMILFLFVIALLSARKDPVEKDVGKLTPPTIAGFAVGGALLVMLGIVGLFGAEGNRGWTAVPEQFGQVGEFGHELLTTYVFPFEVIAFVLMVAVIGVMILVGRHRA
ncbi:MAG: NADH-quinone oxidoreductase subunit J [Symbiobacterium sp.]|uniref:NADH-quinone oxidoreductase subunit J n=1 Tax=Symbiobacterium sp. TaxID=1971213 RepID=UPI003463FCB1